MLTKKEIKACLRGEKTEVAPAYFLWMDSDFVLNNQNFFEEMREKYSDDILQTVPELIRRAPEPDDLEEGEFTDVWGCRFRKALTGVGSHPTYPIIRTVEDWIVYRENYMPAIEAGVFESTAKKTVQENPDSYILMNIWRTFYERMYMLFGMQELWMDMAADQEVFPIMLQDLKEFTLQAIRAAKNSGVDGIYLADDWGTQDRLQISPAAWRRYFKPAYAEMIAVAHELGMDVWMHSCGCIESLIPEFIEIGLDVIGNLQTSALDLKKLADNYRGKITFFGGLDVQTNLTKGTPETIWREVENLTEWFRPSQGRFIFAPSNSIMPETPVENVSALFAAIDHYRRQGL